MTKPIVVNGTSHTHPVDEIKFMKACKACVIGRHKINLDDYKLTFEESMSVYSSVSEIFANLPEPEIRFSDKKDELESFDFGIPVYMNEAILKMAVAGNTIASLYETNLFLKNNPTFENVSGIIVLERFSNDLVFPHISFKRDVEGILIRNLGRKILTAKTDQFELGSVFAGVKMKISL